MAKTDLFQKIVICCRVISEAGLYTLTAELRFTNIVPLYKNCDVDPVITRNCVDALVRETIHDSSKSFFYNVLIAYMKNIDKTALSLFLHLKNCSLVFPAAGCSVQPRVPEVGHAGREEVRWRFPN